MFWGVDMRVARVEMYSVGKQLEDLARTAPDLEIRSEILRLSKQLIELSRRRDWVVPESDYLDC